MLLGRFRLGHETIRIFLLAGDGGECIFDDSRINIGRDGDPVDTLFHEVTEYALFRAGVTYQRTDYQTDDVNARLFLLTHSQFSNIICVSSRVIAGVLPKLTEAIKRFEKDLSRK